MKILHTSDWHLGRSLYHKKRYTEHQAFLDWLYETIIAESIEVLIIAGDIFDTSTPSNRAQELYYGFLCRAASTCCRNIIVIGGNHDSPSFLNAPKELLKQLNVHVVGAISDDSEDEIILIKDKNGVEKMMVCAVPYLRERDIRIVEAGESFDDKNQKITGGIASHYQLVFEKAKKLRESLPATVPLVVTGHLFATGGKIIDGDGVRDLYIGSLARVACEIFSDEIDYVALGHLHVPQKVGGDDTRRYSGSPLPMSFGEAQQIKKIVIVEFAGNKTAINELDVPCFQKLVQISGDMAAISEKVKSLKDDNSQAWIEIVYQGKDIISGLREQLEELILDSDLEILRVKNIAVIDRIFNKIEVKETLADLNEHEVFDRCLKNYQVPENQQADLKASYREILLAYQESDRNAE